MVEVDEEINLSQEVSFKLYPLDLFEPGPYSATFFSQDIIWGRDGGVKVPVSKYPLGSAARQILYGRMRPVRKRNLLKRIGWVAHPEVVAHLHKLGVRPILRREDKLALRVQVESLCKERVLKKGNKQMRWRAKIFRQTDEIYRAVKLATEAAYSDYEKFRSRGVKRLWRRVPRFVYFNPNTSLAHGQLVSDDLRAYGIEGRKAKYRGLFWGILFNPGITRTRALQASTLKRALPPPLTTPDYFDEFVGRLTQPPSSSPEEEQSFQTWVKAWLKFNQPFFPRFSWPVSGSNSSCYEYTRKQGGFPRALKEIEMIQKNRKSLGKEYWTVYDKELADVRRLIAEARFQRIREDHQYLIDSERSLDIIYGCLNVLEPMLHHTETCTGGDCNSSDLHPPVVPLMVAERGGKVRIPTLTLAPVSFLAQILRSMIDPFLRSDPRIRSSLSGDLRVPKGNGLFRSQDLTTATDNHSFAITRNVYLELEKYIPFKFSWYSRVVKLVTGPMRILNQSQRRAFNWEVPKPWYEGAMADNPKLYKDFESLPLIGYNEFHEGNPPFGHSLNYGRYLINEHRPRNLDTRRMRVYSCACPGDWESLHYAYLSIPPGPLTRKGQMMGIATSWPVLPLISLYCFETSSDLPMKTIRRNIIVRPAVELGKPLSQIRYLDWCRGDARTKVVEREVPLNWSRIDTTGDDAIMIVDNQQSVLHTKKLTLLGSEVSLTKDFLSDQYAVYTEVLLRDGKLFGIIPLAPIAAPRGVRSPSWDQQPANIESISHRYGFSMTKALALLRRSKFGKIYEMLSRRGCPLSLPVRWGGIDYPVRIPMSLSAIEQIAFKLSNSTPEDVDKLLHILPEVKNLLMDVERPVVRDNYALNAKHKRPKGMPIPRILGPTSGMLSRSASYEANRSKRLVMSQKAASNILRAPTAARSILDRSVPKDLPRNVLHYFSSTKPGKLVMDEAIYEQISRVEHRPYIVVNFGSVGLYPPSFGLCIPGYPTPIVRVFSENAWGQVQDESTPIDERERWQLQPFSLRSDFIYPNEV